MSLRNVVPLAYIEKIDSYDSNLEGLGTLLMQWAMELESVCQARVELEANPTNFPFYYKLGMRWKDQPIRKFDKDTPDYDAIVLKEIEAARREGRRADTTKLVPNSQRLYLPDAACKIWQEIIQKRPGLYTTQDTHDSCKPAK
jgi:hypothetical protein